MVTILTAETLAAVQSPAECSAAPPLQDAEMAKFAFEELIPGVAKRAVQVKTSSLPYALLVADTLNTLASYYTACLDAPSLPQLDDLTDAMRPVFDASQKFYQFHFQQEEAREGEANRAALKVSLDSLSEEERLWRRALRVHDKIDVEKYDVTFGVSMWTQGVV